MSCGIWLARTTKTTRPYYHDVRESCFIVNYPMTVNQWSV